MMIIDLTSKCMNHGDRKGAVIRSICLHHTAAKVESAIDWFCNPEAKVSAHYIISRAGKIYQMVKEERAAYHAGNAQFNRESLGIELEATEKERGLTEKQDHALITLLETLMNKYNINTNRILLHRNIKPTLCPGYIFETDKVFYDYINSHF